MLLNFGDNAVFSVYDEGEGSESVNKTVYFLF
jgi:hypothetical protein